MPQRSRKPIPPEIRRLLQDAFKPSEPPPPPEPSTLQKYVPPAIRGVGMLLGMTPARGVGASALAELAAEAVEGRFSPAEIGVAGVTGGIGGAATSSLLKNVSKPLVAGLKGAGWGAAQPVAREISGRVFGADEPYEATPEDVALGGLVGGGVAGGLAKLLGRIQSAGTVAAPVVHGPETLATFLKGKSPKDIEDFALKQDALGLPDVGKQTRQLATESGKASSSSMRGLIRTNKQETDAATKAAEEAAAKTELAKRKEGLKEGPTTVRESVTSQEGPVKETATTTFKKPKPKKAGQRAVVDAATGGDIEALTDMFRAVKVDPADLPPEGSEGMNILLQWLEKGRDPKTALKLAMHGRPPLNPAPAATNVVEDAANVAEDVIPQAAAPELPIPTPAPVEAPPIAPPVQPRSPKTRSYRQQQQDQSLEDLKRRLGMESEPAQAPAPPITGQREATLAESNKGVDVLEDLHTQTGLDPESLGQMGTLPTEAPSVSPEVAPELAKFFKSPIDVFGDTYRAAKTEEGINPIATRYLGLSLQNEAGKAGLPTRGKGVTSQTLQDFLAKDMGLDPARTRFRPSAAPEVPPTGIVEPPTIPGAGGVATLEPPTPVPGPAVAPELESLLNPAPIKTVEDLTEQWQASVEQVRKLGVTDPEKLDQASRQILRDLMNENPEIAKGFSEVITKGNGESGAIDPALLAKLGLAAGGALVGGATDPLDNPVMSALGGAAAGYSLPGLVQFVQKAAPALAADPSIPPSIKSILGAANTGKEGQIIENFWQQIPNYLRAGMLIGPNFPNNAWTGPWGSGVMAGLEFHMAGDPIGTQILASMSPVEWMKAWHEALPVAKKLIQESGGMLESERIGGAALDKFMQSPAVGMLAGDIATRNILIGAGMPEQMARRYTLTSEAASKLIKNIVNVQRSGPLGKIFLPFAHTLGNIAEQSAIRIPIIGPMIQKAIPELAYPAEVQAQQQILGAVVPAVAGGVGYLAPDEDTPGNTIGGRFLRSAVSNVAGPYSGLAGVGYGMGKAMQQGGKLGDVVSRGATEALQTVPLPTTDVPMSVVQQLKQLLNGEGITRLPAGTPGAGIINPYIQNRSGGKKNKRTKRDRG